MTPQQLAAARDANGNASAAALALWARLVGTDPDDDDRRAAAAALDAVSQHVGADTDVPAWTLEEAVYRCARMLDLSAAGMHVRKMDSGMEFDAVGVQSSFRRSGAMVLLAPWAKPTAGAI